MRFLFFKTYLIVLLFMYVFFMFITLDYDIFILPDGIKAFMLAVVFLITLIVNFIKFHDPVSDNLLDDVYYKKHVEKGMFDYNGKTYTITKVNDSKDSEKENNSFLRPLLIRLFILGMLLLFISFVSDYIDIYIDLYNIDETVSFMFTEWSYEDKIKLYDL